MHQQLLQLVKKNTDPTDVEIKLLTQYFEPVQFPKNYLLEAAGKVPQYLYFVISGFVRLFHWNEKGEEVTTHINCPPGFITSYTHFSNQQKSDENVECITSCELLRITKKNLDQLIQQSTTFKDFSIQVFHQSLLYNENRAKDLATLNAEQRYLKLIQNYPDLLLHVPMQYIASFLGMNPKSLSRIRKQIIR